MLCLLRLTVWLASKQSLAGRSPYHAQFAKMVIISASHVLELQKVPMQPWDQPNVRNGGAKLVAHRKIEAQLKVERRLRRTRHRETRRQ